MIQKLLLPCFFLTSISVLANSDTLSVADSLDIDAATSELLAAYAFRDSVDKSFEWHHGTIDLGDGLAELVVPEGYKFLGKEQTEFLMSDVFGNMYEPSLGLLAHESFSLMDDVDDYFVEITYSEDGFIEDDDADDIEYDELLEQMQEDAVEENKQREAMGYETVEIVGWASTPYYDKAAKKLHWAKELKFGGYESNTLNYNIRILGRRGYLVMNAIGDMSLLPTVQEDIDGIIGSVHFKEGHRYEDFDSSVDKVAAYGIGGLVAGKLLAKAGFFAILLKFWKFIAIGAVALFAGVKKFFGGGGE